MDDQEDIDEVDPITETKDHAHSPENVFSKSRFHHMAVVKQELQERVLSEYAKKNDPLPRNPLAALLHQMLLVKTAFMPI